MSKWDLSDNIEQKRWYFINFCTLIKCWLFTLFLRPYLVKDANGTSAIVRNVPHMNPARSPAKFSWYGSVPIPKRTVVNSNILNNDMYGFFTCFQCIHMRSATSEDTTPQRDAAGPTYKYVEYESNWILNPQSTEIQNVMYLKQVWTLQSAVTDCRIFIHSPNLIDFELSTQCATNSISWFH